MARACSNSSPAKRCVALLLSGLDRGGFDPAHPRRDTRRDRISPPQLSDDLLAEIFSEIRNVRRIDWSHAYPKLLPTPPSTWPKFDVTLRAGPNKSPNPPRGSPSRSSRGHVSDRFGPRRIFADELAERRLFYVNAMESPVRDACAICESAAIRLAITSDGNRCHQLGVRLARMILIFMCAWGRCRAWRRRSSPRRKSRSEPRR